MFVFYAGSGIAMEEFLSGFFVEDRLQARTDRYSVESETFRLELQAGESSVSTSWPMLRNLLMQCYDWRPVMQVVLAACTASRWGNPVDIEELAILEIKKWIKSFAGLGLLTCFVPMQPMDAFIEKFKSSPADNLSGRFDDAVNDKESDHWKMIPDIEVWIEEDVHGGDERKKRLTVHFYNGEYQHFVEVKFVIKKKRLVRNLVELATEAICRQVETAGDLEKLPVPASLLEVLHLQFWDLEWVRSNTRLQAHLAEVAEDFASENFRSMIWPSSG